MQQEQVTFILSFFFVLTLAALHGVLVPVFLQCFQTPFS